MSYIDPEDMNEEEAAAHEAARVQLVKLCADAEPAMEKHRKAMSKAQAARRTEAARAKKAAEKILELDRVAGSLHGAVSLANEAKQRLIAQYIPRKVMTARDRRASEVTAAQRIYDEAVILRKRQDAHIARRSEKMVQGALKDRVGRLQYHDQTKEEKAKGLAAQVKTGLIRNPTYWRAEEDKHEAEKILAALALQEAEALSNLEVAKRQLVGAQAAWDAALEAAFRE